MSLIIGNYEGYKDKEYLVISHDFSNTTFIVFKHLHELKANEYVLLTFEGGHKEFHQVIEDPLLSGSFLQCKTKTVAPFFKNSNKMKGELSSYVCKIRVDSRV